MSKITLKNKHTNATRVFPTCSNITTTGAICTFNAHYGDIKDTIRVVSVDLNNWEVIY